MLKNIPYRGCAYKIPYITMHASLSRLQCEKSGLLLSTERVWLRFLFCTSIAYGVGFAQSKMWSEIFFAIYSWKYMKMQVCTFLLICRDCNVSHPGYPGAEDQPRYQHQQLQHIIAVRKHKLYDIFIGIEPPPPSPPPHDTTPTMMCVYVWVWLTWYVIYHPVTFKAKENKKEGRNNNNRDKTNRCWALRTKRSFPH